MLDTASGKKKQCQNLVVSNKTLIFAPVKRQGAIAQLVEQRTENPCVPGSIPGGTTINPENQGPTNQVHESVHENAPKCCISGRFFYHVEPLSGIFFFLFSSFLIRLLIGL